MFYETSIIETTDFQVDSCVLVVVTHEKKLGLHFGRELPTERASRFPWLQVSTLYRPSLLCMPFSAKQINEIIIMIL